MKTLNLNYEATEGDVAFLRSIFSYDPDTGKLLWKNHPKQPHRNGKPVGLSRGRVKFENRYMSTAALVWVLHHGESPRTPYVLYKNGDYRDLRIANILPHHRSIPPEKALIQDDSLRSKYSKFPTHERTMSHDMAPEEHLLAAIRKTQSAYQELTGIEMSKEEMHAEILMLTKQSVEDYYATT